MGHHAFHRSQRRPVPLSKLSSRAVLEEELAWFFAEAEIASSLPSNFETLSSTALSGRTCLRRNLADVAATERMEAACAAGTLERRLRALRDDQAGVLFAAFEPRLWPEALERELGVLTGVVVRLAAAGRNRRATDRASPAQREAETAAALAEALDREGPSALRPFRAKAHDLYSRALRAYARARGLGPSVVPTRKEEHHASES